MALADLLNIGRTTKRYMANIFIMLAIFGLVYWDSVQEYEDDLWDQQGKVKYASERNAPDFDHKLGAKNYKNVLASGKLQLTTPVVTDYEEAENEGFGVVNFFQQFLSGNEKHSSEAELDNKESNAFSMRVTDEDISKFRTELPPLIPNYKNPCWIEELPTNFGYEESYYSKCITQRKHPDISKRGYMFEAFASYLNNRTRDTGKRWRIRCFPYFFLLGVSKSGTTDFFAVLKEFVNDFVPGYFKELHYWEWKRCQMREDMCGPGSARYPKFGEYLDTFDAAAEVIRRTMVKRRDNSSYHPLVLGDFSPSTLNFNPCWQDMPGNEHMTEPRYITAHYLYSVRPQTKLIIMLRDPVDRLWSNYRMHHRLVDSAVENADDFHEQSKKEINELENCFKEKTHRACIYQDMAFGFKSYVVRSLYEVYIKDWLQLFPREQFLVIKMEDYTQSRVPYIQKTIKFLGLTPLTPDQQWQIEKREVVNKDRSKNKSVMKPQTRTLLRNFFRPWNHRLAKLLKDDSFTWDY